MRSGVDQALRLVDAQELTDRQRGLAPLAQALPRTPWLAVQRVVEVGPRA